MIVREGEGEGSSSHAEAIDLRTTMIAAVMLLVADLAFALIERRFGTGPDFSFHVTHAALALAIIVVLGCTRRPTKRLTLVCFVVLVLPMLPIFWFAQSRAVAAGALWQPFMGRKVILLGLALLTPYSRTVALGLYTFFVGEWLVLWLYYHLGGSHVVRAAGEPWVTAVYVMAGYALIFVRWRNRHLDEKVRQMDAEAEALLQLQRSAVAVNDRMNTPLQTLAIGLTLLQSRCSTEQSVLDRMLRALRVLFDLGERFRQVDVAELRAHCEIGDRLTRAGGGGARGDGAFREPSRT